MAAQRVTDATIDSAVNALLKYHAVKSSEGKAKLFLDDDYIYLNITTKKIPSNTRKSPFRIPLSHPLMDSSAQVCLIIDDRPQATTPPSDQIKKLVKSQNIQVSKVLRLSKLKANYKPYEARRKLCGSYDLFLVEKGIVHFLPKLIGKEFFKKKRLPLGVDLRKGNLKSQVERALGCGVLYIGTGTCCVMKVGKVTMEKEEIVENVIDAIREVVKKVPKKWEGVRSLHLKLFDSVALPLYQAIPEMKLKIEGSKEVEKLDVEMLDDGKEEGSNESEKKTITESKVVRSSKKNRIKGRIHEVHYMDAEDEVNEDVFTSQHKSNDGMLQLKGAESDLSDERKEAGISDEDAVVSKKGKRKSEFEHKPSKKKVKSKEVKYKKRV